jgi:hypothetical protein
LWGRIKKNCVTKKTSAFNNIGEQAKGTEKKNNEWVLEGYVDLTKFFSPSRSDSKLMEKNSTEKT